MSAVTRLGKIKTRNAILWFRFSYLSRFAVLQNVTRWCMFYALLFHFCSLSFPPLFFSFSLSLCLSRCRTDLNSLPHCA